MNLKDFKKVYLKTILTKVKNKESSYNHIGYLMANNIVTVFSQFLFAPFLTRVYPPEVYGGFSVIFATGTNISMLIVMSYDQSLFLEPNQKKRNIISGMLVTWGLIVSTLIAFIFFLNLSFFENLIGLKEGSFWIFLLPVFILSNVFFVVTSVEVTISKKYKDAFVWGAPGMITSKFISLAYGYFFKAHFSGLYLSDTLYRLYHVIFRLKVSLRKSLTHYLIYSKNDIRKGIILFQKYKKFPLFELPASYYELLVWQAPIYFLTLTKSLNVLGWYGISITLLDAPLRLVSYSVAPILKQKATEMIGMPDEYKKVLSKVFLFVFVIILIPLSVIFFWGEDLFTIVFGEKWAMSGQIASAFSFYYLFRFESDLIFNVMTAMGFQRKKFKIFLIEGTLRIILLIVTYLLVGDPFKTIIIWACLCAVIYFFVTVYAYNFFRLALNKLILLKSIITALFLIAFILRFIL